MRRNILAILLIATTLFATLMTGQLLPAHALSFSSPGQVPMGATLTQDSKLRFLDIAPAGGTPLKVDSHIKYVDSDSNGVWDPGETVIYDSFNTNVSRAGDPLIAGTFTTLLQLKIDSHLKFVDINNNGVWHTGEPVVYDTNGNGLYDAGEPIVAGSPPSLQTPLINDAKVKFVDANNNNHWDPNETVVYDTFGKGYYNATIDPHIKYVDTNGNNVWNAGEPVVYDTNNNGVYDSGEPVLNGTTPAIGTSLKTDLKIKFVDANRSGAWVSGDAIVYDTNNNGLYDSGEPVIVRATPAPLTALSTDFRIKYWDANNNSIWDPGETVVYDTFGKGYYNSTIDPRIKFWDSNGNGIWDPSKPVVYDTNLNGLHECTEPVISGTAPACFAPIIGDPHFRFVDLGRTSRWAPGDSVIYDANLDNIYDTGDTVIAGPTPALGTLLSEPVIAGSVPPIGTKLKADTKIKFVDTKGTFAWDPIDAVTYDSNNNNLYDTGEPLVIGGYPSIGTLLGEPVIAGPVPTFGASLKTDPKIKFIDSNGNLVWDSGEMVLYDSNSIGLYSIGDSIIANGAAGDGTWHLGEPVAYDSDSNGLYEPTEPIAWGSSPPNGTVLRIDPRIKFIDTDGNLIWDPGETVAYDLNNNGVYDTGDTTIVGQTPSPVLPLKLSTASDPLGRIWLEWNEAPIGSGLNPDIYFKTGNGTVWSAKQQVTSNAGMNTNGALATLSNNTMMIVWSSNRTGHPQLFYRFYADGVTNPYPTSTAIQLTSSTLTDTSPSVVQDHIGRIWVTWTRQNISATTSNLYYKYYNGTLWSNDASVTSAVGPHLSEQTPSITQAKDGRIWIVFASNESTANALDYTTTDGTIAPLMANPSNFWTPKTSLYASSTSNEDSHPSIVQARDGGLWVFFQRSTLTSDNILYTNSSSNGAGWDPIHTMTTAPDQGPAASQMGDHRIWVFWNRQLGSSEAVMSSSSDQINNIHDVGLLGIAFTATDAHFGTGIIESGDSLNITVTAVNYGDFLENTTLSFKLNGTIVNTVPLSLGAGQLQVIRYTWQTIYPNWGHYALSATLTPVTGENAINQGDNNISISWVRVSPAGDVNRDGVVNISDLAIIALAYHSTPGSPNWNPYADINKDGSVGIDDLSICALFYHKTVLP